MFVYSKNIVTTEGILRQGIENELEYAKSIAAQDGLQDFIIPLHIDNSSYHLVIGQPNINHIPFNNNWADGLKQLLKNWRKTMSLLISAIRSLHFQNGMKMSIFLTAQLYPTKSDIILHGGR